MVKSTGNLAQCRLGLSEFVSDISHCAEIKNQAADSLLCLNINSEYTTLTEDEVPILSIPKEFFACAPATETPDLGFFKVPRDPSVPFISEVCIMTGITDNKQAYLPTLTEFFTVQSTDAVCRTTFTSVRKLNPGFNIDSDGSLDRISNCNDTSQQVGPAFLPPVFHTFSTTHSRPASLENVESTTA